MPASKHAAPPLPKSDAASKSQAGGLWFSRRRQLRPAVQRSAAQRSDVDVLVQFGNSGSADPMAEYFGLKTQLEGVLGRPVDLLVDGAVRNPYVLAGIDATRQLVCAA